MGLQYGIKQARETLLKLLQEGNNLERRVGSMFSEIGVITANDVTQDDFVEINSWQNKYLDTISLKNTQTEDEKITCLKKLAEEMVYLCTDIIENNTTEISSKDNPS